MLRWSRNGRGEQGRLWLISGYLDARSPGWYIDGYAEHWDGSATVITSNVTLPGTVGGYQLVWMALNKDSSSYYRSESLDEQNTLGFFYAQNKQTDHFPYPFASALRYP